ncbi:MAG: RDD family protein [Halobacteriovoraceae bacterium]|nr:RDD family protein [Halobacteriovoraceae bacterium]
METTREKNQPKITLNLDEFDIDSFDIKPVTKGLGFHDNASKGVRPTAKRKSTVGPTPTRAQAQTKTPGYLQSTPQTVSDPNLLSGIDALYGNQPVPRKEKKEVPAPHKMQTKRKVKEAEVAEQIFAYLIDTSIVIGITSLLFTSFFIFAFKKFNGDMMIYFLRDSIPFIAVLSSLIYITYFSLLEPVGTIGKRFLGLGTFISGTERRSSIKTSFSRAFVSLLSLPLLGIPLILDFHGKLSDTRVLKIK